MSAVDVLAAIDLAIRAAAYDVKDTGAEAAIMAHDDLTEARTAVAEALEAHAELLAWVERAIVPEYSERRPMPENCRKALSRSSNALARVRGQQP